VLYSNTLNRITKKKIVKSGKMKHILKIVMFKMNIFLDFTVSIDTSVTGYTSLMSILKALEAMEMEDVSGLSNWTNVKVRPIRMVLMI
jgi:hypothetical protein